uniref:Ig-like domain-containing protein n=1 Tax=Janthinobacterium lividum TaxID=29581 RepID=A0SZ33_9BURK|nr:conserved hypothetical protein [Janthinobacterium lividum]
MRKINLPMACIKLIPLLLLAAVASCGGGGSAPTNSPAASNAPSISAQPLSISAPEGGSVTFSVTATGTAPLSYQWQRNGSDVVGATSAQYMLQVQASDNGTLWTVIVRNRAGSITSSAAKLTVASKSLLAGAIAGNSFNGHVEIKGIAVDDNGAIYLSDRADDSHLRVVTQQGVSHMLTLTAAAGDATAQLSQVVSLTRDAMGNLYATDQGCVIHKISPAGLLTTLAGSSSCGAADGKGTAASFDSMLAITVDASGSVYVGGGASIRKITPDGTVTTLAGISRTYGTSDGDAKSARFGGISGIAVDTAGAIYVADAGSNINGIVGSRIRKLTPAGIVSTLAGGSAYGSADGAGAVATFSSLNGLTIDKQGNLFVADEGNHTIRKITPAGVVSTLAGTASQLRPAVADGIGAAARFNLPYGLAVDGAGNVYVSDSNPGLQLNGVRKITPAGEVTTITGSNAGIGVTDGLASEARFAGPQAIALHSDGTLFVADTGNQLIRRVSAVGVTSTLAGNPGHGSFLSSGDGTGAQATFAQPAGIVVGSDGVAYIADAFRNTIRRVGNDGVVTTLAGSYENRSQPTDGQGAKAGFSSTNGIAIDGNATLYVADYQAVRKVDANGNVTTLTGTLGGGSGGTADGSLAQARFGYLRAIAFDASGNLYLTDSLNHNVRKITPAGVVTTLAGTTGVAGDADGRGSAASFNGPHGIALDKAGNVYVADTENNLVRRISTSGEVTTVAGTRGLTGNTLGAFAGALNRPMGLAFDANGALLVTSANGVFKLPL